MNDDLVTLKNYIKEQYSKDNLIFLYSKIIEINRRIQKSQETLIKHGDDLSEEQKSNMSDVIKMTSVSYNNLKQQFNNLMTNSGGHNIMILLNDHSRFIVNIDILNYMVSNNYINIELFERIVEDTDERREFIITHIALIPELIAISYLTRNIILYDICSIEPQFKITNYLLNENKLKMLLLEYSYFGEGCFTDFHCISLLYTRPTILIRNIMIELNQYIQSTCVFMFVLKTNESTFGWILERTRCHGVTQNMRVLIIFKIIENVLYTYKPKFYYFSFNDLRDGSMNMIINEQMYVDIIKPNGEKDLELRYRPILEYNETKTTLKSDITLYVDPITGNKTLNNNDKDCEVNCQKIQIYEIGGEILKTLLQIEQMSKVKSNSVVFFGSSHDHPTIFHKYNYTIETIKEHYKIITGNAAKVDTCDFQSYCPVYHPYLCDKDSNFRNNYSKPNWLGERRRTNSKGNQAPCVSDQRFCNMSYSEAILRMDQENIEMKHMPSRNYSSKPIYCKIYEDIGNEQMGQFDGGKYNKTKSINYKNSIRKRSKNIRKRSKNIRKMSRK